MKIQDILKHTRHRPWDIPKGKWKFYQEWNNAIFFHFQVELNELKKYVPTDLEIDLFDGKAWVSVVAFTMENIRPKNLPAFSPISNFDEINIRTYVKRNGKTGVYFLSIEGGKKVSCWLAKTISELPYRFSEMKRTNTVYQSENKIFNDAFSAEYSIGEIINDKSELDQFLTERYALFQDTKNGNINAFEIHHLEWEVREINVKKLNIHYPRFQTLIGKYPDKIHYSKGVQVIAWDKNKY